MDRKKIEKVIFRKLLSSSQILQKKLYSISEHDFSNVVYRKILKAFVENYDILPNLTQSKEYFDILLRKQFPIQEERDIIASQLSSIANSGIETQDLDILIKELRSYRMCDELSGIIKNSLPLIKPDKIYDAYEFLVKELLNFTSHSSTMLEMSKVKEVHDQLEERIQLYFDNKNERIPTFIKAFDIVSGGYAPSEMITVAAGTGQGKSNLLLWWAERYVENGYNTAYITLEMSYEEIMNRYNAIQTGANVTDISRKRIPNKILGEYLIKLVASSKEPSARKALIRECLINKLHINPDKDRILKIASKYKNRTSKFNIIDMAHATPNKIEQEIKKLKNNGIDVKVLFIDFINVLESDIPNKDRVRELGIIARELKMLAKRLNVVLFTAAQLNTAGLKENGLSTDSIKYSKAISENSDWVIAFNRTEEDKMLNLLKLHLVKHRHSSSCIALLNFDFSNMQVKDLGFDEKSNIPTGYDKDGSKYEYYTNQNPESNEYCPSLLSEYENLINEIDPKSLATKEEPKEEIDDIAMLNKLKEIFPDTKIRLSTEIEKQFFKESNVNDDYHGL